GNGSRGSRAPARAAGRRSFRRGGEGQLPLLAMEFAPEFAAMRLAVLRIERLVRDQHDGEALAAALQGAAAVLDRLGAVVVQQNLVVAQHAADQRGRLLREARPQLRQQRALDVARGIHGAQGNRWRAADKRARKKFYGARPGYFPGFLLTFSFS